MPASRPERPGAPSPLAAAAASPWVQSACLGVLSFALTVLIEPPVFLAVLLLSLPFFVAVVQARWKTCIAWTVITVPFQYYFNLGGLALTLTELYLFLFGGAYFLSRIVPGRALEFPALLAFPVLYGLTPFLPVLAGNPAVAKEGVRTLAAVFFCPRPSRSASIARS